VIHAGQNNANEFIIHTGDVLLNLSKCSLKFIGPKVWSSIPDDIKYSTTFTFKWKLKKHLLHEKIPDYEL